MGCFRLVRDKTGAREQDLHGTSTLDNLRFCDRRCFCMPLRHYLSYIRCSISSISSNHLLLVPPNPVLSCLVEE